MPDAPDDVAALREENGRLRVLLEDRDARIAELEERIARLERLISRNSGNSVDAAGGDDLPGKKPAGSGEPRSGAAGRKPGKQRLRHEAQCYIPRSARRDWRYVSGSDG